MRKITKVCVALGILAFVCMGFVGMGDEVVPEPQPILVTVTQKGCVPCATLRSRLVALFGRNRMDRVFWVEVDADNQEDWAKAAFGGQRAAVPKTVLYRPVRWSTGAMDDAKIEELIRSETKSGARQAPLGATDDTERGRSSLWPDLRKKIVKAHPYCACCGTKENLQAHHIRPVEYFPDLELDPSNVIVLCEQSPHNCHQNVGHCGSWKLFNRHVKDDAALHLSRIEEAKEWVRKHPKAELTPEPIREDNNVH